ncbi:DUF1176 domain-containing protein [Leptospira borgpetersenii]|uniref:DUF1176 domain-containing protein n=1 Tax=Leptospira borgpetersenii TaxID=174 RepID=UPI000773A112|nr:DUF1176 domain-containing protein [Leptospira borgpetersenii]MBE8365546.1 DUF1176 domain-containing protein [Leptospira borgpetersenii serovar Balcanica]MBE8367825.1 DUF1176 domain-containing protein [Leptospira borgpetersenii serovar Balcanica]MBE8400149.1 DUF1176 domain-containing protein [Leptospira borgpetersenii serovar Tarassovi]MBE8403278.1 DUF1176 domain-containing protein [Leptospira borgpetersenii serovar Tarassovi]MBE8406490.1 DUF1176 domain-containing protein [Leptospira borgpet
MYYILKSKRFILIFLCCAISIFLGVKIFFSEKEWITQKSGFKRTSIHWPKDCDFIAHIPEERNKHPELICADVLDQLRTQLPKDCEYNELALSENGLISYHRYADFLAHSPIQFFLLSEGKFLGELLCSSATYNRYNIYFIYDERSIPAKAQILTFPAFNFEKKNGFVLRESFKSESIVRFFKPETKEFVSFIKYRGMGDCGKYFRYGLSKTEKPILKEIRVKLECDGTYSYAFDEIPLEWTEISVDFSLIEFFDI